ncbi:peptidase inhibitor family I36 protein, partial [Streptomyces goshikiensis]|uniref:peptidase inhibitor family I36 protein n=1 Tax=Streptomyces goshikiensis TaxID=1942 RepID=UPI00331EEC5C
MGTRCTEVSRCGREGSGLSWLTGLPALAVVIACALSEWCGGAAPAKYEDCPTGYFCAWTNDNATGPMLKVKT